MCFFAFLLLSGSDGVLVDLSFVTASLHCIENFNVNSLWCRISIWTSRKVSCHFSFSGHFGILDKKNGWWGCFFKNGALVLLSHTVADFQVHGGSLFPACRALNCTYLNSIHWVSEEHEAPRVRTRLKGGERRKGKKKKVTALSIHKWLDTKHLLCSPPFRRWQLSYDKKFAWGSVYVQSTSLLLTPVSK